MLRFRIAILIQKLGEKKQMIKISDVIDNMECISDDDRCYFHVQTQTFYSPINECLGIAEEYEEDDDLSGYPEWEREGILEAVEFLEHEDEYIALPNQFDINEYEIMEDFCGNLDNQRIRNDLLNAIAGRGAFRRFKDTIIQYNIEKQWYSFRDMAYKNIAIQWCEENDIEYIE